MDSQPNILDCIINNSTVKDWILLTSHIIVALILVTVLKTMHPYLLATILTSILSYIIYTNKETVPIWLLPILGTFIFFVRVYIDGTKDYVVIDINQHIKKIWEVPLWGIVSYYIMLIIKNN
jgi:hypothetical protein